MGKVGKQRAVATAGHKNQSNLEVQLSVPDETPVLTENQPPPAAFSSIPVEKSRRVEINRGGWTITADIREDFHQVDSNVPSFNRLSFDPKVKVKGMSVTADLYRLFASPKFWKAVATDDQKAIDGEARKLVPKLPAWSRKTWTKVARLKPEGQYAVAQWINCNCGREPQAPLLDNLEDLILIVNAWINFDEDSKWLEPGLEKHPALHQFIKAVTTYNKKPPEQHLEDQLSKRIPRKGKPQKLWRTRRIIEGAELWKNNGRPSKLQLQGILEKHFNWKRKTPEGEVSNSFEELTRQAIALGKARTALT
jgi:hypothetical protein